MNKKQTVLLLLLLQIAGFAQPQVEWQKLLGGTNYDLALSVCNTNDGGYIMAGRSYSSNGDVTGAHGDADVWVVKMVASGEVLWKKIIGGSNFDNARMIKQTADGGYILAGETGSVDGDATGVSYGGDDFWLVKLDASGNLQWQKRYGGSNSDVLNSVSQTPDGGFILAGTTPYGGGMVVGNHGNFDAWILKVNSVGTLQWQKSLGGTGDDQATSIIALNDGGYIFTGFTNSIDGDVSSLHGFYDAWVVKLSNSGQIIWEKTYGGTDMEVVNCIKQTPDGGFVFTGRTSSNDGQVSGNHSVAGNFYGPDIWVVKITNTGDFEWQKCLGGPANEEAKSITPAIDGGYIVVGSTDTPPNQEGDVTEGTHGGDDLWVVKLNATGAVQWQKVFGGSSYDNGSDAIQSADGGYLIVGFASSDDGNVEGLQPNHISDFWAIKLHAENLSTTAFDKNEIAVYPNPTASVIRIKTPDIIKVSNVMVKENTGRIVLQAENVDKIDMSGFPQGMYYITITSGKNSSTHKVIKK